MFKPDNNKIVEISGRANETVANLSKNNKSRKSIQVPNIRTIRESNLITPNPKKTFNYLQLMFIEASIF